MVFHNEEAFVPSSRNIRVGQVSSDNHNRIVDSVLICKTHQYVSVSAAALVNCSCASSSHVAPKQLINTTYTETIKKCNIYTYIFIRVNIVIKKMYRYRSWAGEGSDKSISNVKKLTNNHVLNILMPNKRN